MLEVGWLASIGDAAIFAALSTLVALRLPFILKLRGLSDTDNLLIATIVTAVLVKYAVPLLVHII